MGPQLLWRRIKDITLVPSEAAPRQLSWHLGRGETESLPWLKWNRSGMKEGVVVTLSVVAYQFER